MLVYISYAKLSKIARKDNAKDTQNFLLTFSLSVSHFVASSFIIILFFLLVCSSLKGKGTVEISVFMVFLKTICGHNNDYYNFKSQFDGTHFWIDWGKPFCCANFRCFDPGAFNSLKGQTFSWCLRLSFCGKKEIERVRQRKYGNWL